MFLRWCQLVLAHAASAAKAKQPRRRAFDRESCTATCVAFPHVTSACRRTPDAGHRPLRTTAPSLLQVRSHTAASGLIVPQLFHVALRLRVLVLYGLLPETHKAPFIENLLRSLILFPASQLAVTICVAS